MIGLNFEEKQKHLRGKTSRQNSHKKNTQISFVFPKLFGRKRENRLNDTGTWLRGEKVYRKSVFPTILDIKAKTRPSFR